MPPEQVPLVAHVVEMHLEGAIADIERGLVTAPVGCDPTVLGRIVDGATLAGVEIRELDVRQPSLDEVFLALTGATPTSSGDDMTIRTSA